jgi:hypothetical protein
VPHVEHPCPRAAFAARPRALLAALCALALALALVPAVAGAQEPAAGGGFEVETRYPHVCTTAQHGLGQPKVDNQDEQGIPVAEEDAEGDYPQDDRGYPTDEATIVGWSRDCEVDTQYRYLYKGEDGGFHDLDDPSDPPADVVTTVTTEGDEVPYVVRLEQGTINRFIYSVAMLAPEGETDPAAPDTSHWNGRLLYSFQGGVAIGHTQGSWSQGAGLRDEVLGQGYAVVNSTGTRTNTHYNLRRGGETAVKTKDHFVDAYGEPDYTIGVGGSGGAIQQYVYAQNHPDLLDGGVPQVSYPDMATQTIHIGDCELLEHYMERTDADNDRWRDITERTKLVGLNAEQDPVLGSGDRSQLNQLYQLYSAFGIPTPDGWDGEDVVPATECRPGWFGLTPLAMNPLFTNVRGIEHLAEGVEDVVWTHWDDARDVYGVDADGWARQTWDNVGVQYGLQALRDGELTPEEFLDVNAHVGGWKHASEMVEPGCPFDLSKCTDAQEFDPWSSRQMNLSPDGQAPAPRTVGDVTAIANAFANGHVFTGDIDIPMIDARHYMEHQLDMHNTHQSFAVRQRMLDGAGHHDNQLIWFVDARPDRAEYDPTLEAFEVLHEWITNIQDDPDASVGDNRPDGAADACWETDGTLIASGDDVWAGKLDDGAPGPCAQAFETYTTSRIEAGAPISGEVYKCRTMPVATAVAEGLYGDWSPDADQLARLREVHPQGVCDYGLAGVGDPRTKVLDAPTATGGVHEVQVSDAEPGAEVQLRRGGKVVDTATADTAGTVTITAEAGTYVLAQRVGADRGELSAPVTVTAPEPDPPAPGWPFSDVDPDDVHAPAILRLYELGILLGYPDGTYRPVEELTRGQMASVVARAFELAPVADGPFPDVDPDGVHAGAINALAAAGIVEGRPDGNFHLHDSVTRGQLSSMLARAGELPDGDPEAFEDIIGSVHAPAIGALADAGVVRGFADGTFRPGAAVTRAQAATMVAGFLDHLAEADE